MQTYDGVYAKEEFYWGKEPNRLCRQAVTLFSPEEAKGARVIDLGCGEGKDLIHFAKHGFDATGVDISLPGLAKARRWAAEEQLVIRTTQADLADFRLQETYDLVYASGTLTYLPPTLRAEIFDHYKQHTRVGGYNAFNAFVEKPYIDIAPDWGGDEHPFRSGELLLYYWDWEIVSFQEVVFDCNSSGVPHRHAMDVLIARKICP